MPLVVIVSMVLLGLGVLSNTISALADAGSETPPGQHALMLLLNAGMFVWLLASAPFVGPVVALVLIQAYALYWNVYRVVTETTTPAPQPWQSLLAATIQAVLLVWFGVWFG